MITNQARGRWSPFRLSAVAAAVAVLVTVLVAVLPLVHFAYRAPALHAVLETVNALVALLVAYLVLGRYRESHRLQELLLIAGLVLVAVANLLLTALPAAVAGDDERAAQWDSLVVRLLGAVLIVAAALVSSRRSQPGGVHRHRKVVVITLLLLVGLIALRAVSIERLPPPVDADVRIEDAARPLITGHPVVLGAQLLGLLLYAVAAVAFTRQATRTRDELMRWMAVHCVLAGAARVHYLLFPSLSTDVVHTGDVLRLASYVLLLVGAAREIQSYWQARTVAAVLEDRRRLARDLHDGLTQELTYICAQALRLQSHPEDRRLAQQLSGAAGRALEESRHAIGALTRPADQAFGVVLEETVEDLGRRYDVRTVTSIEDTVMVTPEQSEAIFRITGEALRNAVRHGEARCVSVGLSREPLSLTVEDDGRGFHPGGLVSPGFGLTSMSERAERAGASYALTSVIGRGTRVQVSWT